MSGSEAERAIRRDTGGGKGPAAEAPRGRPAGLRRVPVVVVLACLCVALMWRLSQREVIEGAREAGRERARKAEAARLDRALPDFDFEGKTFATAIEWLRTGSGQNIVVDWFALNEMGRGRDTVVHLKLKGVTLRTALYWLLLDAGEPHVGIQFRLRGDVVVVGPGDPTYPTDRIPGVYDVRDLIDSATRGDRAWYDQAADLAPGQVGVGGGGGGGGGGPFGPTGRGLFAGPVAGGVDVLPPTPTREEAERVLSRVVNAWTGAADGPDFGQGGRLNFFGGRMLVKAAPEAQDEVARVLAYLRAAKPMSAATQPAAPFFTRGGPADPGSSWKPAGWFDPPDFMRGAWVPHGDFRGAKLGEVLDRLAKESGTNIVLDAAMRKEVNVADRVAITLDVSGMPLGQALDLVTRYAGTDAFPLAWAAREGVVYVGEWEPVQARFDTMPTLVYDVRDLCRIESAATRPAGGGGGGPPAFPSTEAVADFVRESVDPDSWAPKIKQRATLRVLPGRLVIRQTPANHRQIERVLATLRNGGRLPAGKGEGVESAGPGRD